MSTVQPSFILTLRAVAALTILWHHFALYAPLSDWAAPLIGGVLDWLAEYARATQVFFVVSGFVAARTIGLRLWNLKQLGRFALQRYCRLGLPYLAVILVILPIYALARDWMPEEVLGQPVSILQFLAHLFFLQDILGYESLSAGLWFVCINFQLGLIYVGGMILQQRFGRGEDGLFMLLGWGASIYSLFYFNLDPAFACWALYFFPYFFMGILAQRALAGGRRWQFIAFLVVMALALFYEWRWRLLIAMIFGLALFFAERSERGRIWPPSLLVARIGEVSYSLFLLHFPVLVLTGALWSRLGWTSPEAAVGGLLTAFVASLLAAFVFYRWVEMPAARLSKRFRAPRQAAGPKANRRLAFEH